MDLSTPIQDVALVGPAYAQKFNKLGIFTVRDLLYHLPFRYEDTSQITRIQDIPGSKEPTVTIMGKVAEIRNVYTRYGKKLTEAVVEDDTGMVDVIWFNQQYLTKTLSVGTQVMLSGKASFDSYIRAKLVSPSYEITSGKTSIHLGRLIGVYAETKGISSKWIRSRIHTVLKEITIHDWLPDTVRKRHNLCTLSEALHSIHFPQTLPEAQEARKRIGFDEMLLIQLYMQEKKVQRIQTTADIIPTDTDLLDTYINSLPFSLTDSQRHAIGEILEDINKAVPMNRLLEGEVGSGKTVVAGAAIFQTLMNNKQACLMAPTSILAKQHYNTLTKLLANVGIASDQISLVTSKSKKQVGAKLFIGTQALLFEQSLIDTASLVIIDEQHRFGVQQREAISNAHKQMVHTLTMTATPIPRTLALSMYGDLDISYINTLPHGRKSILTRIVPNKKRDDLYGFAKKQIEEGRQVFIVCPLVSLSDKLNIKSAEEEFAHLSKHIFTNERLVLLHGQMKSQEKDTILEAFRDKEFDILVSTPVVEVGIDIPNATIMIIEGAERFGLAQLHQLRGRVGRGEYESFCFLLTSEAQQEDLERLHVFAKNPSGLKIAEYDLQNRGPGEVYGVKQSGIPALKAASLLDIELITTTRQEAQTLLQKPLSSTIEEKLLEFRQDISLLN